MLKTISERLKESKKAGKKIVWIESGIELSSNELQKFEEYEKQCGLDISDNYPVTQEDYTKFKNTDGATTWVV